MFIPNSFAGNSVSEKWHFTGDQKPFYTKLQSSDVDEVKDGCVVWVNNMYKNYASLHPEFKPLMKDKRWRKKWRRSMILRGYGEFQSNNSCFYRIMSKNMSDLPLEWRSRVLFCGVITRNINKIEKKSATATEEL